MLRVKIPIGSEKWEAEGRNEGELEASLRVLLRVVDSRRQPSTLGVVGSAFASLLTQHFTTRSETDRPVPPPNYKPPRYKELDKDTNRERFRLALADLMLNFGRQEATANEIIQHLEATGGKYESEAKDRGATARQMMRSDSYMQGTGSGWRLNEEAVLKFAPLVWKNLDESEVLSGENELDEEVSIEELKANSEAPSN